MNVTFESVGFEKPTFNPQNLRMVVHLRVDSADFPATLHGWTLCSPVWPQLKGDAEKVVFGHRGLPVRLEAHDVISGWVSFDCAGPTEDQLRASAWQLKFSDAYRQYEFTVPPNLYRPT